MAHDKAISVGELEKAIQSVPVIDTHEHLPSEPDFLKAGVDVFTLFGHYTRADLVAAGMPVRDAFERLQDKSLSLQERWQLLQPYWPRIRYGEYARSLLITLKDLFGFEDVTSENYVEISSRLAQSAKPGLYEEILRERCRIRWVLNYVDHRLESVRSQNPDFLLPVPHLDGLILLRSRADVRELEAEFDVDLRDFGAYVEFLETLVDHYTKLGVKAVKLAIAYARTLQTERFARCDAERVYNRLFVHYGEGVGPREARILQDFLIRHLVDVSAAHALPVVIHTGVQNDHYHYLEHARATHLTGLLRDFSRARFVLLHGGFPWVEETGYLAKVFPNVYLSMAWMHIMSSELSRHALRVWLDTVPVNKIMAFGGDYMLPYKIYGHLKLAKENVARVLAERVSQRRMTSEEAVRLARMWFYEVPKDVFELG